MSYIVVVIDIEMDDLQVVGVHQTITQLTDFTLLVEHETTTHCG